MKTRFLLKAAAVLTLTLSVTPAFAQFGGFLNKLPGVLTGGGNSASGTDPSSIANNVTKLVKEPSQEEEIALGRETAAVVLGARPLVNNPGLQRYVNTLGRWLASQTERPDLPWTFAVIQDSSYNAFAAPGGYIFVTAGLMASMHNEAELAGVLSHEIAHVVRKHHLNSIKTSAGMSLAVDLVGSKTGGNEQLKTFAKNAAKNMFAKGLSKEDEFQADRDGVVIAARAGYDPYGLPSVLQMLAAHSGSDDGFSLIFSTHPSPTSRLERLDGIIQTQFDKLPTTSGKPLKDRIKEFSR